MSLGYFRTIENGHFRDLGDGSKAFYAQGPLGRKGFIVPSDTLEARIRRTLRAYYIVLLAPVAVAIGLTSKWILELGFLHYIGFLAALCGVAWLATRIVFWPLTRGLERSSVPNSACERWAMAGTTMHPGLIWALGAICLGFAIIGLGLGIVLHDPKLVLGGVFFGALLIPYKIMMKHSRQHQDDIAANKRI